MTLIIAYIDFLAWLEQISGLSRPLLHVHAGLALYVLVQFLMRERRASITACKILLAVILVHECVERLYYGTWRLEDTAGDILLTMMWPVVLTLVGLYRRRHWQTARKGERLLRQMSSSATARREREARTS